MNANETEIRQHDPVVFHLNAPGQERLSGVRVEPSEFEALLERAMEILSARARAQRRVVVER